MRSTLLTGLAGFTAILGLVYGAAPAAAATGGAPTPGTPTPVAAGAAIDLAGRGELLADGAGATVKVTFQCEAGQTYNVFVELSQAVLDGRTASGVGFANPGTCSGTAQTEDLLLLAAGGFYAFRAGDAVARATLSVCPNEQMCSQAADSGVIQLRESFGN